ncbi:HD domain-containing phosphohydrolase [Psychromonas sp. MME2]|uniref:HD-GYP domain-containing protein n=1 Tax=unclassified Psychromonas TaxID=2614957 RepID=UPI00339BDC37
MGKIKLSTDRLAIGLYIQLPSQWGEHPFLFNSFKIKDQQQIKILQSLSSKYVFYVPEKSDALPAAQNVLPQEKDKEDPFLEALWKLKHQRVEANKKYLRDLRKCQNEFDQSLVAVRAINLKLNNQSTQAIGEAHELISKICSKLIDGNNNVLHLMENGKNGNKGGQQHSHAFHVSILAMILGNALDLSEQELIYLGLGGLFHDIGKSKVPDQILNNKPKITTAENNFYKMHVLYGVEKSKTIAELSEPIREIIGQHHEYLDGSGYPEKLRDNEITLLSQIVTVANEYDNMCNPTDKSPRRTPYHALSYLYKNKSKQLNKEVLGILIKKLGVYPPGCFVQLSNQQIGLVISVTENNILQPNILIYDPSIPKNEAPIIALSEKELKIEKVISMAQLPEQIKEYLNPCETVSYYFDKE